MLFHQWKRNEKRFSKILLYHYVLKDMRRHSSLRQSLFHLFGLFYCFVNYIQFSRKKDLKLSLNKNCQFFFLLTLAIWKREISCFSERFQNWVDILNFSFPCYFVYFTFFSHFVSVNDLVWYFLRSRFFNICFFLFSVTNRTIFHGQFF